METHLFLAIKVVYNSDDYSNTNIKLIMLNYLKFGLEKLLLLCIYRRDTLK